MSIEVRLHRWPTEEEVEEARRQGKSPPSYRKLNRKSKGHPQEYPIKRHDPGGAEGAARGLEELATKIRNNPGLYRALKRAIIDF